MAGHKMVVVNGVRYREEDAPKRKKDAADDTELTTDAQHKMREPAKKSAPRKSSK